MAGGWGGALQTSLNIWSQLGCDWELQVSSSPLNPQPACSWAQGEQSMQGLDQCSLSPCKLEYNWNKTLMLPVNWSSYQRDSKSSWSSNFLTFFFIVGIFLVSIKTAFSWSGRRKRNNPVQFFSWTLNLYTLTSSALVSREYMKHGNYSDSLVQKSSFLKNKWTSFIPSSAFFWAIS